MFDKICLYSMIGAVLIVMMGVVIYHGFGDFQLSQAYDSCMYNLNVTHKRWPK